MTSNARLTALAATILVSGCGSITHTPPGTSVEFALAKKGELVKLPGPVVAPGTAPTTATVHVPPVEPAMPEKNAVLEKVAETFSRGTFCMQAERDAEAIEAFQEVVRLDPTFTAAWENLAALYEKGGDTKKALESFKKAKTLARH